MIWVDEDSVEEPFVIRRRKKYVRIYLSFAWDGDGAKE